jgi:hypothetical protein
LYFKEIFKCPAEESANSGRSPLISGRKNSEKTDTRINNFTRVSGAVYYEKSGT